MNEYDSNRIYDLAKQIYYKKTDNYKEADCYVINTCHIREKATEKVYHDVGRIKKDFRNKKKPIVVIVGCVAQAEGEILLKEEKYIDVVLGPQSYHQFNESILRIEKALQEKKTIVVKAEGEARSAELIGGAINKNPAFLQLRRIDAAREVASTVQGMQGKVYLDADNLLLNHLGEVTNINNKSNSSGWFS